MSSPKDRVATLTSGKSIRTPSSPTKSSASSISLQICQFCAALLGLGTWRSDKGLVGAAVRSALEAGVRHIDCAAAYKNEDEIGQSLSEAFKDGIVQRDELFVTSKLWNTCHETNRVREACMKTLRDLKLSYLDLYLLHWPMAWEFTGYDLEPQNPKDEKGHPKFAKVTILETWREMEKLVDEGLVRSIGVSNFGATQLIELCGVARVPPAVNQIELNPHNTRKELVEVCKMFNVHVTAYSAFGSAGALVLTDPMIMEIAAKKRKTAAQVVIRWCIQQSISVIPKSTKPERVRENVDVFDFELSEEEMSAIDGLNQNRWYLASFKSFLGLNPFA